MRAWLVMVLWLVSAAWMQPAGAQALHVELLRTEGETAARRRRRRCWPAPRRAPAASRASPCRTARRTTGCG